MPVICGVWNNSIYTKEKFIMAKNMPQFPRNGGLRIQRGESLGDRNQPAAAAIVGAGVYAADFTASTLTVLGSTHNLGTKDLTITYRDASGNKLEPQSENINSSTFTVTTVFGQSTTGRITIVGGV
jgi:hypothetical protein